MWMRTLAVLLQASWRRAAEGVLQGIVVTSNFTKFLNLYTYCVRRHIAIFLHVAIFLHAPADIHINVAHFSWGVGTAADDSSLDIWNHIGGICILYTMVPLVRVGYAHSLLNLVRINLVAV